MNTHKTIKTFFAYLAIVVLTCGALTAAEAQIKPSASNGGIVAETSSINDQVKALETELARLQKILLIDEGKQQSVQALIQRLPVNQQNIAEKLSLLAKPSEPPIEQEQIEVLNRLDEDIVQAERSNEKKLAYTSDGEHALNKVKETYEGLKQLLSNPIHQSNVSGQLQQQIDTLAVNIVALQQQFSTQIEELSLQAQELEKADDLLSQWQKALSNKLIEQQKNTKSPEKKNNQIADKSKQLQDDIRQLQEQLSQQRNNIDLQTIESLQQNLYEKQTLLWLLGIDEKLIAIIERPTPILDEEHLEELNLDNLNTQQAAILAEQQRLTALKKLVDARYAEFQKHTDITGAQPILEDAFTERMRAIAYQSLLLHNQPKLISRVINDKKQRALFSIDTFYTEQQFISAPSGVVDSLVQIAYQIQISFKTLLEQLTAKPIRTLLVTALSVLFVVTGIRLLARWAKASKAQLRRDTSGVVITLRKLLHVLRKNSALLTCLLFVLGLVFTSDIPYPSDAIICTLIYVLAAAVIWLTLTRVESRLTTTPKTQVTMSIIVSVILALAVGLYATAYMTAIEPAVLGLYEKILMIASVAFVWVEREKFTLYFTKPNEALSHKAYTLYRWLLDALPWAIIATCLLNLVGFSRLSWLFLSYLGVGMLYITVLVLGIKLINYWRKKTKLYALKRFNHGAFIATDMVSPLSTVCKVLWIWATTAVLFRAMLWDGNSYLIANFLAVVQYPLITIGKTVVTLQIIALSILALYAIVKMAKWLRTFSYHWLYSRIQDLGVRGSLSIFTQYVAVVIGVIIALNVLGIDLTSLAVFAGALGVGVGLGLQDTAKNFISGILLLIERPLRNGDWVSIDGNEGTVKSIGMRAITMETFDKQEVIIPNGNAIGNSFINNTHSDSVLRTVLYIGADYDSDPEKVMQVLENILNGTEDVLNDPKPLVVLWEYADSSINYRIQYYVNIDNASLYATRTKVLNQVWQEFKANQIEIPYPQRDVNFRNRLDSVNPTENEE